MTRKFILALAARRRHRCWRVSGTARARARSTIPTRSRSEHGHQDASMSSTPPRRSLTAAGSDCASGGRRLHAELHLLDRRRRAALDVTLTAGRVAGGLHGAALQVHADDWERVHRWWSGTQCGVGSWHLRHGRQLILVPPASRRRDGSERRHASPGPARSARASATSPPARAMERGGRATGSYLDGIDQGLDGPGSGFDVPVDSLSEVAQRTARGRDAAATRGRCRPQVTSPSTGSTAS